MDGVDLHQPLTQNKKIFKMKKVLDKMHILCYTNSGSRKFTLTSTNLIKEEVENL